MHAFRGDPRSFSSFLEEPALFLNPSHFPKIAYCSLFRVSKIGGILATVPKSAFDGEGEKERDYSHFVVR